MNVLLPVFLRILLASTCNSAPRSIVAVQHLIITIDILVRTYGTRGDPGFEGRNTPDNLSSGQRRECVRTHFCSVPDITPPRSRAAGPAFIPGCFSLERVAATSFKRRPNKIRCGLKSQLWRPRPSGRRSRRSAWTQQIFPGSALFWRLPVLGKRRLSPAGSPDIIRGEVKGAGVSSSPGPSRTSRQNPLQNLSDAATAADQLQPGRSEQLSEPAMSHPALHTYSEGKMRGTRVKSGVKTRVQQRFICSHHGDSLELLLK